jgi:hypothetical protein
MNVIEIVKAYLMANGYDGLCNPLDDECGCGFDDICDIPGKCVPAWKHICSDGGELFCLKKPGEPCDNEDCEGCADRVITIEFDPDPDYRDPFCDDSDHRDEALRQRGVSLEYPGGGKND